VGHLLGIALRKSWTTRWLWETGKDAPVQLDGANAEAMTSVPREMARAAWRAWLRPRDFGVLTWLLWGATLLTIGVLLLPTVSRYWASRAFAIATLAQPLFAVGALMAWFRSGRGWARVEDLAVVPNAGGLWVLANVRALGLVLAIQALALGAAVAWILRDSMLTNEADTFYAFMVFIGGFVVSGGCDPTLMLRPHLGDGGTVRNFAQALITTPYRCTSFLCVSSQSRSCERLG
jgi:hypothetical protein